MQFKSFHFRTQTFILSKCRCRSKRIISTWVKCPKATFKPKYIQKWVSCELKVNRDWILYSLFRFDNTTNYDVKKLKWITSFLVFNWWISISNSILMFDDSNFRIAPKSTFGEAEIILILSLLQVLISIQMKKAMEPHCFLIQTEIELHRNLRNW